MTENLLHPTGMLQIAAGHRDLALIVPGPQVSWLNQGLTTTACPVQKTTATVVVTPPELAARAACIRVHFKTRAFLGFLYEKKFLLSFKMAGTSFTTLKRPSY